jgi:NAD(P)-dependent dehydrogenase (short-subunit alcohol dehydrogenase family)
VTTIPDPLPPAELFDLTGQVAVVTGASAGLGDRFVRVLHAAGASVLAVARRADRLALLAEQHERVVPLAADVADRDQVEGIVPTALERFGRLDILVNNAGITAAGRALTEDIDDFRRVLEVNLVATYQLARRAGAVMVEAGAGSIINLGSVLGFGAPWPIPNASYSASKAGVINLTRDLACQWATTGVRVNALAPGIFPSELADLSDDRSQRYVRAHTPMQRMGRPEELDGPLLFLASRASSFMTGQVLVVDGGWTAH